MKPKNNLTPIKHTSPENGALTLDSAIKTPEERAAEIKQEIAKYGAEAEYTVEVKDPITHKKTLVTYDRAGHTEQKLIVALANPDVSREKKDHALSMYLFERGAESASFIADIMRSKGEHTKETRVFKNQMRFDFQSFVDTFVAYLDGQANRLAKTLDFDLKKQKASFEAWLNLPNNKGKGYTYYDYDPDEERSRAALIEMAIYALDEADTLRSAVERIAVARDAARGFGVFTSKTGRTYDVRDPALQDIIKAEREFAEQNDPDYDG